LDKDRRIIAVLVGRPDDPEWSEVVDGAAAVMRAVQQLGIGEDLFSVEQLDHRHGEFLAIPVGVSFGGGQTVRAVFRVPRAFSLLTVSNCQLQEPGNLVHTKGMRRLVRKLLQSLHIQRIMGFQSSKLRVNAFLS
jgi:hypothetical protein